MFVARIHKQAQICNVEKFSEWLTLPPPPACFVKRAVVGVKSIERYSSMPLRSVTYTRKINLKTHKNLNSSEQALRFLNY
jgi:hypothetical protein